MNTKKVLYDIQKSDILFVIKERRDLMTWFLKVDDVTVKYEDFVALDSVSI